MTSKAKRIFFTMDEKGYNEIEHIGKAMGLTAQQTARLASYMFILSVKHQDIKLFLNDDSALEKNAIETLQLLSGLKVERTQ